MPLYKRPYLISKNELLVIKKYINKYLNKRFIYFSMSLAATPILLAKKLGGGIRFCINYKGLNIIAAFNHLQIQKGDEWKTTFILYFG